MDSFFWCITCAVLQATGLCHVDGAQVLALLPMAAKSHWNVMDVVLQTLVARGHNVTVVTPFIKAKPVANYTEVDMSRLLPSGVSMSWQTVMGLCSEHNNLPFLSGIHRHTCKTVFEHEEFWHVIKSHKYDLFVTELLGSSCDAYISYHLKIPRIVIASSHVHIQHKIRDLALYDLYITELLGSSCDAYISYYLKIPRIVIASSHVHTWYHHTFGSHMNPAHVSTFHAPFAVPTDFVQRMLNAYDYVYSHLVFKWVDREATAIGRKYFGSDAPDADTLMSNSSLMLVNGHYTVDLARPLPPNFVNIGGIHLTRPKPLPEDLEEYINNSPNGVIYFTFGSTIKMDTAPVRLQRAFVEALGELPVRVLWKYESEVLGDLPENVMIRKWFPQRDILAHHNVKLFISHGGMSGIYEAIDSGIPVLGIPLFFDQPHNIANIVHWGAGLMLDHETLTKDILVNAVNEMLSDYTRYKSNALELSRRFSDRPRTPQEEVIYWTEYVIKHNGAHHLKSAALQLSWYQYFLVDVLIVVLLIILFVVSVIVLLIKSVRNYICSMNKPKKE